MHAYDICQIELTLTVGLYRSRLTFLSNKYFIKIMWTTATDVKSHSKVKYMYNAVMRTFSLSKATRRYLISAEVNSQNRKGINPHYHNLTVSPLN